MKPLKEKSVCLTLDCLVKCNLFMLKWNCHEPLLVNHKKFLYEYKTHKHMNLLDTVIE